MSSVLSDLYCYCKNSIVLCFTIIFFKRKMLDLVVRNLSHYLFTEISYMDYAEIGINYKFQYSTFEIALLVTTEIILSLMSWMSE
jgi:hypothetical protein